jgi:hypothetical protein
MKRNLQVSRVALALATLTAFVSRAAELTGRVKILVEVFKRSTMIQYAELCGWTLARAHARSGEPAKISGYLGKSDRFDQAVADFSVHYADQSERDHSVLMKAVRNGRLEVLME